jgi:hypothetical protein
VSGETGLKVILGWLAIAALLVAWWLVVKHDDGPPARTCNSDLSACDEE